MRTRIIAILALLATTLGTHADDVVTVVTQNGQKSYSMDKLVRIELGEDNLVVVGSDEKGTTYAFDKVQKILISLNTTALNDATADSKPTLTLTVSTDGAEMSFNGWDSNIAAPLYVYDAGGRSVLHRETWRGETIDISALAKGVYVVKAGEHTAKFRK